MRKTTLRKFFLFGRYSLAILPPKKWLTELDVKAGDSSLMEFDRKKQRIIIHLQQPEVKLETIKNPDQLEKTDDWQPIPPL